MLDLHQDKTETRSYRLNSLVTWHLAKDGERLQVRFPDGDHITFDRDGPAIASIFAALSAADAVPSSAIADDLIALLVERRALEPSKPNLITDWMEDALDYFLRFGERAASTSSPVKKAKDTAIVIVGEGWLADIARDAARLAGLTTADEAYDGVAVRIAVADLIAYDHFSAANAAALASGQRIAFLWREVSRIVFGPLVLPGHSACFECYRTRVRANLNFPAEFDARATWLPSARNTVASPLAEGAAKAFVARQLLLAAAEIYDLVEPATLYSYDVMTLESARQPVLRVSRCRSCGVRREAPQPAVRALA